MSEGRWGIILGLVAIMVTFLPSIFPHIPTSVAVPIELVLAAACLILIVHGLSKQKRGSIKYDLLLDALINAQIGAEELLKLQPTTKLRWTIWLIKRKYRKAVSSLNRYPKRPRTLTSNLVRGKYLLDISQRKGLASFKAELDDNAREIIQEVKEMVKEGTGST